MKVPNVSLGYYQNQVNCRKNQPVSFTSNKLLTFQKSIKKMTIQDLTDCLNALTKAAMKFKEMTLENAKINGYDWRSNV